MKMKVSLSHIMKPLKNDSNIDKERRESTTIYFTSIRQSDECVGGIEWTELLMLDEIAWKKIFAFLAFFFLFVWFVLARDRSRNLFFSRARDNRSRNFLKVIPAINSKQSLLL